MRRESLILLHQAWWTGRYGGYGIDAGRCRSEPRHHLGRVLGFVLATLAHYVEVHCDCLVLRPAGCHQQRGCHRRQEIVSAHWWSPAVQNRNPIARFTWFAVCESLLISKVRKRRNSAEKSRSERGRYTKFTSPARLRLKVGFR